ncbi:DUF4129 domain-containing protein [Microbispora sp. ATCC PTA-5024]|uniref:DUF4129 domain-containing protein n=1 Tax=Microbispora sp. ATCC PTA-5024 TaxID=316330 RepID=UPI0003FDBD2D|nr:DUF4129 domain-containing protein [Microbispora sp. ATCC PTA-5024]
MTLAAAAFLLAGPDVGREEARREAARELLRPVYQHESVLDRMWRTFTQFLGDLLDAGGGTAGGVLSLVLIVVVLVALAALLLWALRRMSRDRGAGAGGVFERGELTAAEHRAAAGRLAAEGDWSGAIRERLRAVARDLEERAIVTPLPGRTAMELADVAGRALPDHAADLRAVARVFDDVTYGEVPGTREAYETMAGLDERLRAARVSLDAGA